MVSPVQFSNNRQVYFRGENEDLLSSPGAFQQSAAAVEASPADEVVISSKENAPKKKGGIGKTIATLATTTVVVAGALFGLFKWKGAKWLNPHAATKLDKFKNAMMKPGEWLENTAKSIGSKLGIGGSKATADAGAATTTAAEGAATKAGEEAATAATTAAEGAAVKAGEEAATAATTAAEGAAAKAGEEAAVIV